MGILDHIFYIVYKVASKQITAILYTEKNLRQKLQVHFYKQLQRNSK